MDFGADLPNLYNYYDLAERYHYKKEEEHDHNEGRRYWFSRMGDLGEYYDKVPFSICANTVQVTNFDIDKALDVLRKTNHVSLIYTH